jgi:tetrahydromethanopterin S-methyltransferase subunit C
MDFSSVGSSLEIALGTQLPRILGAIVLLIIGWIIAVIVRGGVRRLNEQMIPLAMKVMTRAVLGLMP